MMLARLATRCWRSSSSSRSRGGRGLSTSTSPLTYDYVVVGGGSAGCVLANRLSANPRVRVLLLEAGGDDRFIPFVHVPGYLWSIANPEVDWCFKTEPVPGLGGRALNYPRGKVLGGSSSINGMIYMRGQAADYDEVWAPALQGQGGWSWKEVLPYFVRSEDHHDPAAADGKVHGRGGEWRVEKQRLSWEILDRFQDAAAEHGIPKVKDFNSGDNFGSSYFEVNQKRGVRWSTSKGFLHSVRSSRPNLTVQTGAHVTRVLFDDAQRQRAVGVEFFVRGKEGQLQQATAGLATVLAAGAVGSPQLLQLSGVGPASVLREKGVRDIVLDAPGVGANLQDHIQVRNVYRVRNTRTLNEWYATLWGRLEMALRYVVDRSGPLSMAPSQLGVFAKSDKSQPRANLEYHVQPLSLDRFGAPLHTFPAFTAAAVPLQPTSRGSVVLRDLDPRTPPVIQPNYLSTAQDRKVAADAIRLTRRIALESEALRPFQPQEHSPTLAAYPRDAPDDALAAAAAQVATTIFHPSCTNRMGTDGDPMAVLDPILRVRGLEGLSVADASSMPRITSGNTNSPTILIAEKAADFLHARHGTGAEGRVHRG